MKMCNKCGEEKPLIDYHKNKNKKDGLHTICKTCNLKGSRQHRLANPEYMKQYSKQYAIDNVDQLKHKSLKKNYNITLEDYNTMLFQQNGKCAICGTHHTKLSKSLAVDHCHTIGQVRGLLCIKCNRAIGMLNDDPKLLKSALKYLKDNTK